MDCSCYSEKKYTECCEPYHKGKWAESALQLMRSRYAAYAQNLPKYIIRTTHSENPHYNLNFEAWEKDIADFCRNFAFIGLEILDFQENKEIATVTFVAHLEREGRDSLFKEKSLFKKVDGQWYYFRGEVSNN